MACITADQARAGLDILTDGDARFDLDVGGRSWFFYPIERLGGIEGHVDRRRPAAGKAIAARPHPVEVRRRTSPRSRASSPAGPLEYAALWKVAQRMATGR